MRRRRLPYLAVAAAIVAASAVSVVGVPASSHGDERLAAGSFALTGNVQTPLDLSVADLAALPNQRTITVTYTAGGTPETHTFTGPRLREVLALAGPKLDTAIRNDRLRYYVSVSATDNYQALVGYGEFDPSFENKEVLLAVTQDGMSLAAAGPRLVVPGDAAGGRYVSAVNSVVVHKPASAMLEATTPLQASVASLTAALAARTTELATKTSELTTAKTSLTQTSAQIVALTAQLRRLELAIATAPKSALRLAEDGLGLSLSGSPNQTLRVRALITAQTAKRLGLRSRVIALQGVSTGVDGTAGVLMRVTARAGTALRRHRGKLALLAEATTGDRRALAGATIGG